MRHTDVLIGVHGSGLNNAMFMEPGSVVIAIMPSNYVEYEWHNFITGSGSTYLFQPTPDNKGHVDPKCNYNKKRELTKSKHAMPFNGGRNPAGRVAKLD